MELEREKRLKEAFKRVKEDIYSIKTELTVLRRSFLDLETKNLPFLRKISETDPKPLENGELTEKYEEFSTGNQGVNNNQQQSTTINSQRSAINNNQQQIKPAQEESIIEENESEAKIRLSGTEAKNLPSSTTWSHNPSANISTKYVNELSLFLKSALERANSSLFSIFSSLTDREFSLFLTIAELEKQLPEVSFSDLSLRLSLTESTIRGSINSLINKGAPIEKKRFLNKKVSLSTTQAFKDLNLLQKLLELRNPHFSQKTLFDEP